MRDRCLLQGAGKLIREHVNRDDRGRFRVSEELYHLMRGIERIDIHEHTAGFENAECNNPIGEPIGNLNRDPGAWLQMKFFPQKGGKIIRVAVNFSKG